jgi:two-component sensor histidine kinase
MSLVHELLMNHESLEYVSSLDYIQKLVQRLKTMVHSEQKEIEFIYYADDIKFEEKQCIAVGMIISELVSNSIKYAFTDIEFPIITISLNKEEQFNGMRLSVSDNGNGKINDILLNKSLGYRLIDIFIEQLNGKYIIENINGLVVTFTFPI